MLCSDFYCLLQPKVLNLTIVLTNNLICVSNQRMITPMFEHVTRAHAGTRHVSHEEHAPLAYFASRSLSQFLTPALRFFPTFLSFFLFVSHTISFFLLSSVSFFSSCQIQIVLCSHSLLFRIFSSLFIRRGFICYLSLCCNLKPILDILLQQISRQNSVYKFIYMLYILYIYSNSFKISLYCIKLFEL